MTVDVVVVTGADEDRRLVLVRRGREPQRGMWALPGGFVDEFEPLPDAAARELAEETGIGLAEPPTRVVGAYGEAGRDPRGWTVSVAYLVRLPGAVRLAPRGGDDADEAREWPVGALPPLAFDHARIVADAMGML